MKKKIYMIIVMILSFFVIGVNNVYAENNNVNWKVGGENNGLKDFVSSFDSIKHIIFLKTENPGFNENNGDDIYDVSIANDGSVVIVSKMNSEDDYTLYIEYNGTLVFKDDSSKIFEDLFSLESISFDHIDTSNVTNMSSMFYNCSRLKFLDLSKFNTSNVINMNSMFSGCGTLMTLDLSVFNTTNVTDMNYMFSGCNSLTKIFVSSLWNTDNVEPNNNMFGSCYRLLGDYGTAYGSDSSSYARIDDEENPGYLSSFDNEVGEINEIINYMSYSMILNKNGTLYSSGSIVGTNVAVPYLRNIKKIGIANERFIFLTKNNELYIDNTCKNILVKENIIDFKFPNYNTGVLLTKDNRVILAKISGIDTFTFSNIDIPKINKLYQFNTGSCKVFGLSENNDLYRINVCTEEYELLIDNVKDYLGKYILLNNEDIYYYDYADDTLQLLSMKGVEFVSYSNTGTETSNSLNYLDENHNSKVIVYVNGDIYRVYDGSLSFIDYRTYIKSGDLYVNGNNNYGTGGNVIASDVKYATTDLFLTNSGELYQYSGSTKNKIMSGVKKVINDNVIVLENESNYIKGNNNNGSAGVGSDALTISDYKKIITKKGTQHIDSIALSSNRETVNIAQSFKLNTTIYPKDYADSIEWISTDSNVVTVDDNGNVTAVGRGNASIMAVSSNGKYDECTVKVVDPKVLDIVTDKEEYSFDFNGDKSFKLKFEVETQDHPDFDVSITSSNSNIITIDNNGNGVIENVGSAVITIKAGDVEKTININIYSSLNKIILNKTNLSLTINKSETLEVSYFPENTTYDKTIAWTSSNDDVATVDENGVVIGLNVGQATITATTSNGLTAQCEVTVVYPAKATIKFDGNGGTPKQKTKSVYVTLEYGTLPTATKKGFSLVGWYTAKTGGTKINEDSIVTGNKTLYAHWAKTKYTINYVLNGGTNNTGNPAAYTITSAKITFKNPTRKGYRFLGWYKESTFKTKVTYLAKGSVGNRTLYAKWTPITYKITFNKNGGTGTMTAQTGLKYNKAYYLKANAFKRKGYSFAGWNRKADGTGAAFTNKQAVKNLSATNGGNVVLYARWKKVNYKITYNLNGGTNNTGNPATYTITTSTITLKNPTKKGYRFLGWYSDAKFKTKVTRIAKGSTGNKTLYAKWSKNKYTISYVLNGGKNTSLNKTSYTITDNVYLWEPTRSGYIFIGWYLDSTFTKHIDEIPKGTVGNKTLYAKWAKETENNRALKRANEYLSFSAFSYAGLIEQLEYSGFSHDAAVYAADNCGADWYEQALRQAKDYLESMAFSYADLIDQLESEYGSQFTHEQAVYAADNCGADWYEQALRQAKSYLESMTFSYAGLIDQLESEYGSQYTHEQAVYAANNCGADWYEQALRQGRSYMEHMSFSYDELVDQLESEYGSQFTHEQAVYAADIIFG